LRDLDLGEGKFRIELDRFVIVGDGAVEVAFVAMCVAAIDVGLNIFRIELDRLRVIGNGAV